MKFEAGIYYLALGYFDRQIAVSDLLAGTYYYKALCYKAMEIPDLYAQNQEKAVKYYREGKHRIDTYAKPIDKNYLLDIHEEKSSTYFEK